jgi:hypothetical protein
VFRLILESKGAALPTSFQPTPAPALHMVTFRSSAEPPFPEERSAPAAARVKRRLAPGVSEAIRLRQHAVVGGPVAQEIDAPRILECHPDRIVCPVCNTRLPGVSFENDGTGGGWLKCMADRPSGPHGRCSTWLFVVSEDDVAVVCPMDAQERQAVRRWLRDKRAMQERVQARKADR